jgi:hypothetical protein
MGATKTIVTKALKDPGFRQRLVKDPKAVIEQELGIHFPEGVSVQVHENSSRVVHLVLPGAEVAVERGLSEQDLAAVAGGMSLATGVISGGPVLKGGPTLSPTTLPPIGGGPGTLPTLPGGGSPIGMATFGPYTGCCS